MFIFRKKTAFFSLNFGKVAKTDYFCIGKVAINFFEYEKSNNINRNHYDFGWMQYAE